MKTNGHFTLHSKAGRFVFPSNTILSHAKLIRDTITAAFLGSIPGVRIDSGKPQYAPRWVRENMPGPVANAAWTFEWEPTV